MIIEKLTLSNWLSYPDKWVINGKPQKPCFDFQNHPSYVIFGKNGAGKSSIMEAILFALFGDYARTADYRGKKRQGVNNDSAIRSGESSANIELIFSLNGQRHKIQRILNQRNSNNKAYYSVWNKEDGNWSLQKSDITAVNEIIDSLIGMKRDLFCGTVVLEQGKAGRFMELQASAQVDYVINLLGLDIYARYYEQAKKLGNEKKRRAREIENNDLLLLTDASQEAVTSAEEVVEESQTTLQKTDDEFEKLNSLLEKAKVVSGLRQEIARINSQIEGYDVQLAQKTEIETAVQYIQEWEQTEPKLNSLRQTIQHFTTQQKRVTDLKDELQKAKDDYESAKTTITTLEPQYEKANHQREAIENSLPELNEERDNAQQQLELITAERKLDEREAELLSLQEKRRVKLADWESVKRNYYLRDELRQAGIDLKGIVNLFTKSKSELEMLIQDEQSLTEWQAAWQNQQDAWQQQREQIEELATKTHSQQEKSSRLGQTVSATKALLHAREKADGHTACPTCGTTMEGQVLDRFHQELFDLRQRLDKETENWQETVKQAQDLETQLANQKRKSQTEQMKLANEERDLANEQRNLHIRQEQANKDKLEAERRWKALQTSLNYATEIIIAPTEVCLDHARKVLITVNNANHIYDELRNVQAQFDSAQQELERINTQRQHPFATFTQVQQDEATELLSTLDDKIKATDEQLRIHRESEGDLGQQLARAEQQVSTLSQSIQTLETEKLPNEKHLLETAGADKEKAFTVFESSLAGSSWPSEMVDVLRETAVSNQSLSADLHSWLASQRPLAQKQEALQRAIREIENLRTRQSTLQGQIDIYPDEVQQTSVINVTNLLQESKIQKKHHEQHLQEARQHHWQEKQRLENKQKFEAQYKQLINEGEHFQTLAMLLAPPSGTSSGGPLLRQIMQDALQNVATIASTILEEWGQTTEVIVPEEALLFKILDRSSSIVERDYQLFSGGEKFMVALAMALAIGEVAGNTGQMDCLFIDEGFGLLDKDNRDVIAHEIVGNLINHGRRRQVIVITHMEDIRSAFPDTAQLHLINEGNATQLQSEGVYDHT